MDFSNFNSSGNENKILGNELSYSPVVIKPPDKAVTHGHIFKNLVIDSRDRDVLKYPDPNNYQIQFHEDYRDVVSMELIYAKVPSDYFNIIKNDNNKKYKGNNLFYITFTSDYELKTYEILEGYYTVDGLIDTLNGQFGDLLNNNYLFFLKNDFNQRLMIYSPNQFIFNADVENCNANCSIDKVLGYNSYQYHSNKILYDLDNKELEYISGSELDDKYDYKKSFIIRDLSVNPLNYMQKNINFKIKYKDMGTLTVVETIATVMSVSKCNIVISFCKNPPDETVTNIGIELEFYYVMGSNGMDLNDYLILEIPEFHTIDAINDATDHSFMIMPDLINDNFNKAKAPVSDGNIKYFGPPKDRIASMRIIFKNYNGNIVNFNGQEHYLMFKVTALNQPPKYNNYIPCT